MCACGFPAQLDCKYYSLIQLKNHRDWLARKQKAAKSSAKVINDKNEDQQPCLKSPAVKGGLERFFPKLEGEEKYEKRLEKLLKSGVLGEKAPEIEELLRVEMKTLRVHARRRLQKTGVKPETIQRREEKRMRNA